MTAPRVIRVSYPVPYTCQFTSPELVADFLFGGRPLETDPHWADYGASTPDDYAHWAMRSCGVVCVKMVVEGLGGPVQSVMDWIEAGLALDGYLTGQRAERPVEIGWKHSALAELARAHGCRAELLSGLNVGDLAALVRSDRCLLASVSSEIGEGVDLPITRRNGHIVVVHGYEQAGDDDLTHLFVHNPSGRSPASRRDARLPVARFAEAFDLFPEHSGIHYNPISYQALFVLVQDP